MSNKVAHGKNIADMNSMIEMFCLDKEDIIKLLKNGTIKSKRIKNSYIVSWENANNYFFDHLDEIYAREKEYRDRLKKVEIEIQEASKMNVAKLAEILKVDDATAIKLIKEKKIKSYEKSDEPYVYWEDAIAYLGDELFSEFSIVLDNTLKKLYPNF